EVLTELSSAAAFAGEPCWRLKREGSRRHFFCPRPERDPQIVEPLPMRSELFAELHTRFVVAPVDLRRGKRAIGSRTNMRFQEALRPKSFGNDAECCDLLRALNHKGAHGICEHVVNSARTSRRVA